MSDLLASLRAVREKLGALQPVRPVAYLVGHLDDRERWLTLPQCRPGRDPHLAIELVPGSELFNTRPIVVSLWLCSAPELRGQAMIVYADGGEALHAR